MSSNQGPNVYLAAGAKPEDFVGGCLCGKHRFQASALPFASDYCHCRTCQRMTGAPVSAWIDFEKAQFAWLNDAPAEFASSEKIRRGFCTQCGSTLSYRHVDHPGYITVPITVLDNPNLASPTYHIFTDDQVNWLVLNDTCRRYPQNKT